MTSKTLTFTSVGDYKAPCMDLSERVPADLLCDSNDGYTEDIGDVEDFTW